MINNKKVKFLRIVNSIFTIAAMVVYIIMPILSLTPLTTYAADTGFNSPSAQAADIGGDNNGFEVAPANAFSDDTNYASNMNGDDDAHRFYDYNFTLPSDATVKGIEVRLDWWLDSIQNDNNMYVQLSWNGGASWTSLKTNNVESTSDTNNKILGNATDTWGRTWSVSDFTNTNFRVRVISNSSNPQRDFYLDWVGVKVYYKEFVPNPQLSQSCGLDIALVIDSSGSISPTELNQMKAAFTGFVNTFLPMTPTQFSVTDFDWNATILQSFTENASTVINAINIPTSGGNTNWEQALVKAQSTFDPRPNHPNLIIFSSDGNPNTIGDGISVGESTAVQAAVVVADNIKNSGIRIITLGIGDNLKIANLTAISSADAVYTSNFDTLAADLANLASQLCGGTITARKIIDQDGDIQTTGDQIPGANWNFDVAGSQQVTDQSGYTQAVEVNTGTYSVSETLQDGYSFITASCSGAANNGTLSGLTISGIEVENEDIVSCVFYNYPLECTQDSDCDDGLYCNGQETCLNNLCNAGTPIDCSNNNISGIETCTNSPDDNPFTFDYRGEFTSQCNENTDTCTMGDETITYTCSVNDCQAQCDAQNPCQDTDSDGLDGCVGNDYYDYSDVANTCQGDCTCENNQCGAPNISYNDSACTECQVDDNCNSLDADYCEGSVIKHDEGVCENYSCVKQTTILQDCNDGLYCNGQETCSQAQCVAGTAVDCSNYNISGIGTCTNSPDDNPFTFDYRCPFTSQCDENTDTCTMGNETINHNCDFQCGGCTSNGDCDDQNQYTTDTCNLNTCQCENTPIPYCGDDNVDQGEECDNGAQNGQACTPPYGGNCNYCSNSCQIVVLPGPYCGDNVKNGEEGCDGQDGVPEHYICTDQCTLQYILYCGDDNVDQGEECDNGTQNGQACTPPYGGNCNYCSNICQTVTLTGSYCGDEVKNGEEECDGTDGLLEHYTCTTQCVLEYVPYCGDAICNGTETCSTCSQDCGTCPPTPECTPQATSTCSTGLLGICEAGIKTCDEIGFWGSCVQTYSSTTEICGNSQDDNCNGIADGDESSCQPYCGDGSCNGTETCSTCSQDCGSCVIVIGGGGGGGGGGPIFLNIFSETNGDITSITAVVSWFTNLPATSRVIYDVVPHDSLGAPPNYGYAFSTLENSDKVTFHSLTITSLSPNVTYYWRAISHGSGEIWGKELIFTTPLLSQSLPPGGATTTEGGVTQPAEQGGGGETEGGGAGTTEGTGGAGTGEQGSQTTETNEITQEQQKGEGQNVWLAAIGNFFSGNNLCWIINLILAILTVLSLLAAIDRTKKLINKKRWEILIVAVILLLIIVLFLLPICRWFIPLLIALIIFIFIAREKQ